MMEVEVPFEGCDVCGADHATVMCPELGLQDSEFENVVITRARLTLPHFLQAVDLNSGEVTVYATEPLKKKSQFGPYEAKKTTHEFNDEGLFVLKIMTKDGMTVSLDTTEESECNWMCLIQAAISSSEQNLMAYQLGTSIYYSTTKDIAPGTELRVWYAPQYGRRLGKNTEPDGFSKVMLGMKVVYPSVEELAESQTITNSVDDGSRTLNPATGEITSERDPEVDGNTMEQSDSQHQIEEDAIIANFHCRRCGEGFMTEIDLGKHLREHINPLGSRRKGRLPKTDKSNKLSSKNRSGMKLEKEESDSEENDEDFTPKTYQMIKQEPENGVRLRILPRRSLKGKRTTGFLVDNEFLLSKNQIKTEPEETQQEIHVVIEKKDASLVKRKRGRPRSKPNEEKQNSENPKRQKIFENAKPMNVAVKHDTISGKGVSPMDGDLPNENSEPVKIFKDNGTGKAFNQNKISEATGNTDFVQSDNALSGNVVDGADKAVNNDENVVVPALKANDSNENITTVENSTENLEQSTANDLVSESFVQSQVNLDVELGDDIMANSTIEAADILENPDAETADILGNSTVESSVILENSVIESADESSLPEDTGQNNELEEVCGSDGQNTNAKSLAYTNADEKSTDIDNQEDEISEQNKTNNDEGKKVEGKDHNDKTHGNLRSKKQNKNEENSSNSEKTDVEIVEKPEKKKRKKKSLPIPMAIRETPNGKEYLCTICNKKFFTERYLRLHAPMHTSEFKCEICDKTFARKESMQKHECRVLAKIITEEVNDQNEENEQQSTGRRVYRCSNCNVIFDEYVDAERHLSIHRKGFECEHCNRFFVKRVQYNQHICPKTEECRFSCDICAQTFVNEQSLFQHIAMHTDIFKCENCEKCFSRKDSLIRHVTNCCPEKAEEYGVYSCKKCSKTFGTKLGLENHEANCDMHLCEVCQQVFDSENNLNVHNCKPLPENTDLKSKRVKFSCTDCNKSFRNLHYLLQHKQVHCSSHACKICGKKLKSGEERDDHERFCLAVNGIKRDGKIKCDRCGLEFYLAKEYKEHYQTHTHTFHCERCEKRFVKIGTLHTHQCLPTEGFKCKYCKREFKSYKFFQNHMSTHSDFVMNCQKCNKYFESKAFDEHECENENSAAEDGSAKYVCHFCGKNFVSTSNLNKHMKVHGDKNIECEFCGKKFHYPEYLKVHIAGVHEKKNQFQCSDCGKILTSKPGLVSHMKLFHMDNKDVYPCPECGKCFSQKGNMKTHMFSHAKERSFQCTFCPKAFKYPDQLNRHKLIHTMGTKYQCEICEKTFVKDYELKKHLQANHSNKMYVCEFCGSRCGHRHTVQRHYRRKHPASAQLVESPQYLDSLFQEVDLSAGVVMEKNELLVMEHTAQVQQPNGITVSVPIDEMISQSAAEALSSLSMAGNTQAVISNEVAQLISQDGTIIQIPGQENMFTLPNQEGSADGNQQTVVILQIVNPQEQQIEVTELETHVIDSTEIETISQDVSDFQYTENILSTS